jgi:pimeloyl-ACP methyl ester carboxylesterase
MSAASETRPGATRLIDVGGRRLAAQVKGAGVPVLLEVGAGGGGIGIAWNGVDDGIAAFASAIVYDRAGVGLSDAAQPAPTTADRVCDITALLDGLGVHDRVVLVGWSLGGLIVQHFALLNPERIAGLVLVDPTPVDTYSAAPRWQRWLMRTGVLTSLFIGVARTGALRTARGRAWLQRMLEAQLGPKFDRAYLPRLVEMVSGPELHEKVRMESAALERSCADVAGLLETGALPRVPVIVLTATLRGAGAVAKASARVGVSHARTAERAGGELRELAGVSHSVPFEAPEAIVQAVRDIVGRAA